MVFILDTVQIYFSNLSYISPNTYLQEVQMSRLFVMLLHVLKCVLTVLSLLEQLSQTHTPVQQLLGSSIQIRTELSESGHLTVLSQLQFHGTGHLMNNARQINTRS